MNWIAFFHIFVILAWIKSSSQDCTYKRSDFHFGYSEVCRKRIDISCVGVTEKYLVEYLIEKGNGFSCQSYGYCFALYIKNSVLPTIDTRKFSRRDSCYFYELSLDNVEFKDLILGVREEELQLRRLTISEGNFTVILRNIIYFINNFKQLEVLSISGNILRTLEKSVFYNSNKIHLLYLTNNQIESIAPLTFIESHNLEELDLTNNKISLVSSEMFLGLKNLKVLNLTKNRIHEIEIGSFKHFPFLRDLQLGNNYLKEFKFGTFSNLWNLLSLNLSFNHFSAINETMLFSLHDLRTLDLDNNNLTHINYPVLLSYIPTLQWININNNNWSCSFLIQMLHSFRTADIGYNFPSTLTYEQTNIDGVWCKAVPSDQDESSEESIEMESTKLSENNVTALLKKSEKNVYYNIRNFDGYLIFVIVLLFVIVVFVSASGSLVMHKYYFKSCTKSKKNTTTDQSGLELINN